MSHAINRSSFCFLETHHIYNISQERWWCSILSFNSTLYCGTQVSNHISLLASVTVRRTSCARWFMVVWTNKNEKRSRESFESRKSGIPSTYDLILWLHYTLYIYVRRYVLSSSHTIITTRCICTHATQLNNKQHNNTTKDRSYGIGWVSKHKIHPLYIYYYHQTNKQTKKGNKTVKVVVVCVGGSNRFTHHHFLSSFFGGVSVRNE